MSATNASREISIMICELCPSRNLSNARRFVDYHCRWQLVSETIVCRILLWCQNRNIKCRKQNSKFVKIVKVCENYIDTINLILYIIALFAFKAEKINQNFNIICRYFYLNIRLIQQDIIIVFLSCDKQKNKVLFWII